MLDGSSTCSLHEVCLKILATFLSHWLSPFDWNVHCWNSSWFGSWQMSADRSRNLLTWNNPLISRITILYSQSPKNQEHLSPHPISELLTVHWAISRNIKAFQKVFVSHSLNTPSAYKSVCMTLVNHKLAWSKLMCCWFLWLCLSLFICYCSSFYCYQLNVVIIITISTVYL